jgi:hypothetical protein
MLLLLLASGRQRIGNCGERRIGLSLHVKLLQLEVVPKGMERGQRLGALDEGLHVFVLLAEPTKKLKDEVVVRQLLSHGADLVRHALHLASVVIDAKTALSESTNSFIKLKDTSLMVAVELGLDSKPRLSGCLRGFTYDLLPLDGEGGKHPC